MSLKIFLIFSLHFLSSLSGFAQTNSKDANNTSTKVLDFEADVIEGDKLRPDLFLDLKTDDLMIDDLLYMRSNFDDYYKVDTIKKPKVNL